MIELCRNVHACGEASDGINGDCEVGGVCVGVVGGLVGGVLREAGLHVIGDH